MRRSLTITLLILSLLFSSSQLYASFTDSKSYKIRVVIPEHAGTDLSLQASTQFQIPNQNVTIEETLHNNERIVLKSLVVR